jgi:hypothetical protein
VEIPIEKTETPDRTRVLGSDGLLEPVDNIFTGFMTFQLLIQRTYLILVRK